jgi:L-amino acid N-acyltransferase YncA
VVQVGEAFNMASIIRLASESDASAVAAIYRPIVEATATSFELQPPSDAEMRERITDTLRSHAWLVFEQRGEVAAYAYGTRHRSRPAYEWSVETSVYVHERFRGQGVGRSLYQSLLAVLSLQGYVTAFAGIVLPNAASVALHERVGFTPVGVYRGVGYKFGAWHDVGWWQRSLRSYAVPPPAIRDVAAVQATHEWQALRATSLDFMKSRISNDG